LGVATVSIIIFQGIASGVFRGKWLISLSPVFPIIVQFVFGGLLSVVFVYYFRSAELLVSWPLIILLGSLMAGNELWKKRLEQLDFQVTVLFLLLLFFSIFAVPLLFGTISAVIFLLSVSISIITLGIFLAVLSRVAWDLLKARAFSLFFMQIFVCTIIVALYFLNVLPPIPLVTRADGVYHALHRDVSGDYVGNTEGVSWGISHFPYLSSLIFHRAPNEPIYFYSAVYAPTQIHTPIVHVWQNWDSGSGGWTTSSRIEFPIAGGRGGRISRVF
jgi:hypothetical protein